jgi:hypothetical protein
MAKPTIFTISAAWDDEAHVWSGHCDDIPAAADAPTPDELLAKISAIALDLLPENHPDVEPASVYLQVAASREAAFKAHLLGGPKFHDFPIERDRDTGRDVDL